MAEILNTANRARTTLTSTVGVSDTSFDVADATLFPSPPFVVTIEDEIMEVGAVVGNTFSGVKRGQEGTVAVGHDAGCPLENRFTAGTYGRVAENVIEQKLKIAQVEKALNDYKATLQQINVNQEATQSVTGYGIISLPPNAANGQVSVTLFGNTEVDEEGNTKSTISASRLKSVGKNLLDYKNITDRGVGSVTIIENGIEYEGNYYFVVPVSNLKIGQPYVMSWTAEQISGDVAILPRWRLAYTDGTNSSYQAVSGDALTPSKAVKEIWLYSKVSADVLKTRFTDIQLEPGSVATAYEPYTESNAYVVATDSEGKIIELRSLPNGVKDEINVTTGKATIRIGHKTDVASGTVINYVDMADGGQYYAWNNDGETETGIKGDTLEIDATSLNYQLAKPIETPVQVSGTLVSYPSGTVYIEPFVADAGIYVDKMEVLYSDLPIKALEKISKVDFDTGLETELDITKAVIAEDKLSFTHPDLTSGDIVFFVYEHGAESTEPETEISYYDSRYVIKGEDDKFYQWEVEAKLVEGVITPSIKLVEV
jgi:hypothetical protein